MAKIIAPNNQYTGVSASVSFVKGEGTTTESHLIKWFKDHGYKVIEDAAEEEKEKEQEQVPPPDDDKLEDDSSLELKDMTVEELTAYAKEKGVEIGNSTSQKGILKKIQDAEVIE